MKMLDEILAESPVFAGLSAERLAFIAGCGRNVVFEADAVLAREGEPADAFYLVRHGAVALEIHVPGRGGVTVETVHEGDIVGWSWLFPPYRWHSDARAVERVRAVSFDGACLRGKCDADHDLGYELMTRFAQIMVDRLRSTRLRLLDVYGHLPR
jgi:CRP/FNR family cyclic AMP-dependent transcriptional regulator